MDIKRIGKNFAQLRKAMGYTQDSLAEKLNISPQAVSKWETGAGLPEASMLIDISSLLGVSIDEIINPDKKQNIADFINRNLAAPTNKTFIIYLESADGSRLPVVKCIIPCRP